MPDCFDKKCPVCMGDVHREGGAIVHGIDTNTPSVPIEHIYKCTPCDLKWSVYYSLKFDGISTGKRMEQPE